MLSFSKYCENTLLEFAQAPSQRSIKEAGLYTFKQKPFTNEKPGGSLSNAKGEIFMLMTPKQFYQLEKKQKLLKNPPKQSLSESYWEDLKAMSYESKRDYKSWLENITLRIRLIKNFKNYSEEAIVNKVREFNKLLTSAFNEYASAYNSQSEKAFREVNPTAKQRDFRKDFIEELEKKNLKDDVEIVYSKGLTRDMLSDQFNAKLLKATNHEMRLVKDIYSDPAVNKPLLHPAAMMDGLEVEDESVLIDYILGKNIPLDGIVKNIYKKDGSQLKKRELRDLFDEINAEVKAKTNKGIDKEKAVKSIVNQFAKDPEGQTKGDFKYFFYDGLTKTNQKFAEMNEQELERRLKSYNKTTAAYERLFTKTQGGNYEFEPDKSLSQNQKMMKSMGALGKTKEIYDFTLPAYKGLVYMERSWTDIYGKTQPPGLAIVNTCPSAALCKSFCYATKGFYTMYSAPSISAAQVLSFLINHPEQFAKKTAAYLKTLESKSKKEVVIRWHDAGDFFSRKYFDLIMNIAKGTPNMLHYAYTKRVEIIHEVVTGKDLKGNKAPTMSNIPDNFVFSLSMGGKYDKKISKVPELAKFKFSQVIDLEIPAHEEYFSEGKKVGERKIFSDSVLARLERVGEENFNSINAKQTTTKQSSANVNGTQHRNVTVKSKVASFNYIPKLAVHGAEDLDSFTSKNSELLKHFPGIEKEHAFEMMFKSTKGKQGRYIFDEKKLDNIMTAQQVKDLEKKFPNLYKTYLPDEVLKLYKQAIQKYYGFDKDILTYDEMNEIPEDKTNRNKYHVLVSTNDGDVSAQRKDVHGTLLIIH